MTTRSPNSRSATPAGSDPPEVMARFNENLSLAEAIAKRMNRPLSGFDEFEVLLNSARMGLLDAARRYEPHIGVPFAAFASYRIRGAVMDEIRRVAPYSRKVHERLAAAERLTELGEADWSWKRDALPASPAAAEKAIDNALAALAISAAVSLESLDERMGPSDNFDLEAAVERRELLRKVNVELASFGQEEAEVIRQHYFLDRSLTEIASDLGLTLSWVSRLHSRALARLSERFASQVAAS